MGLNLILRSKRSQRKILSWVWSVFQEYLPGNDGEVDWLGTNPIIPITNECLYWGIVHEDEKAEITALKDN